MFRHWLAPCLILAVAGCGGAEAQSRGGAGARKKMAASTKKAFAEAQKKLGDEDVDGAIAVLEAALPEDPENVDLLINLTIFNENSAEPRRGKPDFSKYQKAKDYLERALAANPDLSKSKYRGLGALVFFNSARGLARDQKPQDALKQLQRLQEFGFKDFQKLEENEDLASVRALPEFPALLAELREAYRNELSQEIARLFEDTDEFDFDFELDDIEGKSIAMSDFKGQVLIVDFWGTWCPPCRAEVPHFIALYEKYKDQGLEIVGLNVEHGDEDENLKMVQEFHRDHEMNYRCALADEETIQRVPNLSAFPTTLFFDRSGKVRVSVKGALDFDTLEMIVQKLLAERPAAGSAGR